MSSKLLLSLFIHGFPSTLFSIQNNIIFLEQTVFSFLFVYQNLIQIFQTDCVDSSTQSNLVIQNSCSTYYPLLCHPSCTSVLSQLYSLAMIYFILGVKSWSPTLLVAMSANWRPPLHQSIVCILYFSPFLTECIILVIWLVFLVSLPCLAINTADLPSNIIRRASYGTLSGSFFNSSLINILEFAKAIHEVYAALESLSAPDWATGAETCVPWSIVPPW